MEENNRKITGKETSKKKKKKNRIKKLFLKGIFFVLLVVGFCFFITSFEAFNLKDIQIEGNNHYEKQDIENTLNIVYGKNLFKQIYHIKKADKTKLAYIDSIKISMVSNNVLKIKIDERKSEYIVFNKENSKYYKMTSDGVILEECDVSKKSEDEIILLGISLDENVVIGSKIDNIYLRKIDTFVNIKNEYENTNLKEYGKITKVKFSNSLTTITINDKLNVILPEDKNIKYNLSLLQGIIKNLPNDPTGTIDMTKTNPVYSAY